MSIMKVTLERVGACTFEARDADGNRVRIGASAALADQIRELAPDPSALVEIPDSGAPTGPLRPMALLLASFAACSAIDLVLILAKQRQDVRGLTIDAEGQRPDTTPAPYTKISMTVTARGPVDPERLARATELSVRKYCSVGDSLSKEIEVTLHTHVVTA